MDMLDFFLQDRTINKYLRHHPKSSWPTTLKKLIVYGISSVRALEYSGLPSTHFPRHSSRHRKKAMVSEEPETQTYRERSKGKSRCRTSRVESKITPRAPQHNHNSKRRIPKYYTNVNSKSRPDVQKHKTPRKFHRNTKETPNDTLKENDEIEVQVISVTPRYETGSFLWNESPVHNVSAKAKSSDSSLHSAYPPSEVKQFYLKEFSKLMPEEIPRRLEPMELHLDDSNRFPSHSAQFLSYSSDVEEPR